MGRRCCNIFLSRSSLVTTTSGHSEKDSAYHYREGASPVKTPLSQDFQALAANVAVVDPQPAFERQDCVGGPRDRPQPIKPMGNRRFVNPSVADDSSLVSFDATEDSREEDGEDRIRRVSFGALEIRSYKVVIGDHPCTSQGCSVSLGWEYDLSGTMDLDKYEASRKPRRSFSELKLSPKERHELLLAQDCNSIELRRACRKLHRARSCNGRVERRVNDTFFHGS